MQTGRNEADFWRHTPAQIARTIRSYGRATMTRRNEAMSLAWHTAAFTRTQKRLPRLETLLLRQRRRQTWQEQLRVAQMWAARGFGKIRTKSQTA